MSQYLQIHRFHSSWFFTVGMPLTSWVTLDELFSLSAPLFFLICKMKPFTHCLEVMKSLSGQRTVMVLGRLCQNPWTSGKTGATLWRPHKGTTHNYRLIWFLLANASESRPTRLMGAKTWSLAKNVQPPLYTTLCKHVFLPHIGKFQANLFSKSHLKPSGCCSLIFISKLQQAK